MIGLSICIATLNRARYLEATLASIVPQLRDDVEVVVVDGASTDDTADVVARWQAQSARIRYRRQPTNSGLDADYAAAVALARGRYCWLFTDDDVLLSGAIDAVQRAIATAPALVVLNAEVWNADFTRCLRARRFTGPEDQRYRPGQQDALLADAGDALTFIGAVVIRRDVWAVRDKDRYVGSLFIHFGVIFQATLPGDALVIATPYIRIRYGNATWTARSFEIWMFKWPALVWSVPLSDTAKRTVVAREPWRNPVTLLLHRAAGSYSLREYARWIDGRASPSYGVLARAIACVPFRPLNVLARVALVCIGRHQTTTAVDLRNARRLAAPSAQVTA